MPEPATAWNENTQSCSAGSDGIVVDGLAAPLPSSTPTKPGVLSVTNENCVVMSSWTPRDGTKVGNSIRSTNSAKGSFGSPWIGQDSGPPRPPPTLVRSSVWAKDGAAVAATARVARMEVRMVLVLGLQRSVCGGEGFRASRVARLSASATARRAAERGEVP